MERKKYYKVMDANNLLPQVEYLLGEMMRVQDRVRSVVDTAERIGIHLEAEEIVEGVPSTRPVVRHFAKMLLKLSQEYAQYLDNLSELGIILEDPALGMVSFCSKHDGNDVMLSWQMGEPEIMHWHAMDEDFATRRSIECIDSMVPCSMMLH